LRWRLLVDFVDGWQRMGLLQGLWDMLLWWRWVWLWVGVRLLVWLFARRLLPFLLLAKDIDSVLKLC
jgi:hypothetical protein